MTEKNRDFTNGDGNGVHADDTTLAGDSSKVTFLSHVDDDNARVELVLEKGIFIGLRRDELKMFEHDPKWKRLRIALFCVCVFGWLSLLGAAIYTTYYMPGCPWRPHMGWPERSIIYEIHVPSFRIGSACEKRTLGDVNGILDILNMPNITSSQQSSRNYFLSNLCAVNTLWLRGLHVDPSVPLDPAQTETLNSAIVGEDKKYLLDLFTVLRKKKRFVLIDLLPYELTNEAIDVYEVNCTFLAGLKKDVVLTQPTVKIRCFTEIELESQLLAFIKEHARYVNGFVLDFSPWLVRTEAGSKVLKNLVQTVQQYDETIADSSFKDFGKKYVFMRMPVIGRQYNTTMAQRMKDENVAKDAGVRVVIETIDMISDSQNSCGSSSCLVSLVNDIQKPQFLNSSQNLLGMPVNKTQITLDDIPHRAFTTDDPLFRRRALPNQDNDSTWSPESLAAFVIAALPGSPVVYYGSEIGMSHQSPKTRMKWRSLENNMCYARSEEPYCYCSEACSDKKEDICPASDPENPEYASYPVGSDKDYPPSVSEQVRTESPSPLKTITSLLKAKSESDSLIWGKANASLLTSASGGDHSPLSVVRSANDRFADYALIIAFSAKAGNFPAEIVNRKCYDKVVFHNEPKDAKPGPGRFDQMVVQAREVRLVKLVHCSSCPIVLASFSILLACFAFQWYLLNIF